jgi:PAS domain S-box-containing protein
VANDELKHMDENLMENELVQQRERLIELEAAVAELSKNLKSHKQAQEDIRKSEEKYRNILDNVTDGIYMVGVDGYITYLNRVSLKRTGLPDDNYTAYHYLEVIAPEDHDRVRANFERVMRGEENPPYELRSISRDGRNFIMEVKSRPLFDGEKVVGLLGIARDITARKQAEEALRQSEEKHHALLESISDGVFHLDASGHFVYMNTSGMQRTGLTKENLHTSRFQDMVTPGERKKVKAHFKNAMKGEDVPPFELKYVNRKGRTIYVEVRYRPILENQAVVGVAGISRDITAWKEAEEVILNAKNRLEQMVEIRTKELEDKTGQLALRTQSLEEMNAALNVLLKKIESDKKEIEENIRTNLQEALFPHLENLKDSRPSEAQKACISAMQEAVKSIATPFMHNLRAKLPNISSKEMLVSSLIRDGRTTKEIATILNISIKAVEFHRYNIRKKLHLTRKKAGLAAYLSKLVDH